LKNIGRLVGYGVLGGVFAGFARSLWPNVLYEPPKRFRIGKPEDLADGVNFFSEHRLYVFKRNNEIWSISAVCTHLGCTVNYVALPEPKVMKVAGKEIKEEWEFHCPCHGSKYVADGTPYAGPAPRPLPHYYMEIDPATGMLVVDTSKEVPQDWRFKLA